MLPRRVILLGALQSPIILLHIWKELLLNVDLLLRRDTGPVIEENQTIITGKGKVSAVVIEEGANTLDSIAPFLNQISEFIDVFHVHIGRLNDPSLALGPSEGKSRWNLTKERSTFWTIQNDGRLLP